MLRNKKKYMVSEDISAQYVRGAEKEGPYGLVLDVTQIWNISLVQRKLLIIYFILCLCILKKFPQQDFNTDDRGGGEWLEDCLLQWMGNVNYTAEV